MCMIKGIFQTDFITLDNLGCTCAALKFTLKMSTLIILVDILSTISWWPTTVLFKFPSRNLAVISTTSRIRTEQATSEMLKRSANSLKRQNAKRKAEQASAYGPAPAKKGTISSDARTSESATTSSGAASSSSRPQEPSQRARVETGEWQRWYGKWYQKIIR